MATVIDSKHIYTVAEFPVLVLCKHFNTCFFPLKKKGLKIICLSDFPLFQVSQVFISYSNVLKTWHPCAHVNFMVNSKLSLSLSPSPSPWQSTDGSGRKKCTGPVNCLHSALESKNRYRTLFLSVPGLRHLIWLTHLCRVITLVEILDMILYKILQDPNTIGSYIGSCPGSYTGLRSRSCLGSCRILCRMLQDLDMILLGSFRILIGYYRILQALIRILCTGW